MGELHLEIVTGRIKRDKGVDLTLFAPPTAAALAGRETRLVTTSRLVPKKGVEYGIRAAAALSKAGHAVQYTIVGDGQLRPHLEQLAFRLGAERIVRFLGWQRQPEVAAILADSDILLAPSVTAPDGDQEGIPVAIMEAMAMALPVVSTWHGGIPELVRDGVTGILVREGDTETLAAGVARLIEHPEVRAAMGQAGRARVAAEHNASIQADRLVDLYRRVLAVGESPHTTYGAAPHE
jgi:colanic acid/amylovoran biosynthesis glycosyltransferase